MSISDVLHPKISSGDHFDVLESDLLQKDQMFKEVWEIFCEEIVAGQLNKPGKKKHTEDPTIKEGTVVLVLYPSRNRWRYGKVNRLVSRYRYEVLMKHGKTYKGLQIIDRCNLVSLFLPKHEIQKAKV